MTLGDLKKETLTMMGVGDGYEMSDDDLALYAADDNYRSYLLGMPGAVNRCLGDIEEKRVLPSKSFTITPENAVLSEPVYMRFDIPGLISDFFDIDRLVKEDKDGTYDGAASFLCEGNTLILPTFDHRTIYRLLYKPSLPRISHQTSNHTEMPIPQGIAALMPYFCKGELYREDEPNEAGEARNFYEAGMAAILGKQEGRMSGVCSLYSQTE